METKLENKSKEASLHRSHHFRVMSDGNTKNQTIPKHHILKNLDAKDIVTPQLLSVIWKKLKGQIGNLLTNYFWGKWVIKLFNLSHPPPPLFSSSFSCWSLLPLSFFLCCQPLPSSYPNLTPSSSVMDSHRLIVPLATMYSFNCDFFQQEFKVKI